MQNVSLALLDQPSPGRLSRAKKKMEKKEKSLENAEAETAGPIGLEHTGAWGYPVMLHLGAGSDGVIGLQGLLFSFSLPPFVLHSIS